MSTLYSLPHSFTQGRHCDYSDILATGGTLYQEWDPYTLYLRYDHESIPDWRAASKHLWCPAGKVVVEMLQVPEKVGNIYLPQTMRETHHHEYTGQPIAGLEPSVGVVLQRGEGVDVEPGTLVLCVDGDGVEFGDFKAGEYAARGKVRMFGIVVPDSTDYFKPPYPGYHEVLEWSESIVATLQAGGTQDMERIKPLGRNMLIRKDPFETKTESGIFLPDVGQERTSRGTVVSIGADCRDCAAGDVIVYHPEAEQAFYDADDPDLRIIHEETVLTIIESPAHGAVAV